MNFKQDLKKVMILYPEAEVQSSEDYRDLVNIHNIVEATFGDNFDPKLVLTSFNGKNKLQPKTANDYYYLIFKSAMDNKGIQKFAYPMMFGPQEVVNEFDIDKWAGLVHEIYDAVNSGDMNLNSAIDYYSATLSSKTSEDENFKKWIKYFQDGEHLKYSTEDEDNLKKEGFQFPLSGPGTYAPDSAFAPKDQESLERFKKKEQQGDYMEWRSKLYSAIRRIDKLLRQSDDYIDQDTHRDLADLLHHFDQELRSLRHPVTAADLSYRYANQFKKAGFSKGYDELIKYAQEMAPSELDPLENREDVPEPATVESVSEQSADEDGVDEEALSRALSGGSQAEEGEYEKTRRRYKSQQRSSEARRNSRKTV